ncbi:ABC transporter permease [Kocuria rhizophila]|nr:ABC transporter permease [Kocuria rhizophila]
MPYTLDSLRGGDRLLEPARLVRHECRSAASAGESAGGGERPAGRPAAHRRDPRPGGLDSLATEVNRVLGMGHAGQPRPGGEDPEQNRRRLPAGDVPGDRRHGHLPGPVRRTPCWSRARGHRRAVRARRQRARELALLRCVGATSSRLRRAVLLEGLTIGVVASAIGVAAVGGLVALSTRPPEPPVCSP